MPEVAASTGVNQNTDTTSGGEHGEKIERSGSSGEGTVSFDELESLLGGKSSSSRHEDADTPKIKKRGGDDDKPEGKVSGQKKAKNERVEDDEDGAQDPDDKSQKAGEGKGKDKEAEAAAAASKNVKTIKIKNGDQDLDLRADSKITVKVAGKDEQVTVQELMNEFSGKTDWSRKYTELDTERKTFHAERQELQTGIDDLFRLCVTESKPLEAVQMLTEMLGGDGVKQVMEMRKQLLAQAEEYAKLTPEQREIREAKERADLLDAKIRRRDAQDKRKSEETKLADQIADVKAKNNMDDARYEEIRSSLKKAGNIPEAELTPELIGAVHVRWNQMDAVDEITGELKLEGDSLEKAKNALLTEWGKDKSLSKDQIRKIALMVFGKGKGKSPMQKKLEKSGSANTDTSASRRKLEEPTFFDDLD